MSAARIRTFAAASARMLVRDRTAFFFTLAFPLIFMVLFGLIFGGDSTSRPTLKVVGSGPLVTALEASGTVDVEHEADRDAAVKVVEDGDAAGALIVDGRKGTLFFAASDPVRSGQIQGIVRGVADSASLAAAGATPLVAITARPVEDDDLGYVSYLVPGLLAMAIAQSAVFGVAFSVVAYRQKGMFRRLALTPLTTSELFTARIVMHLGIALVQTVVLLGVGMLFFDVDIAGNALALLPLVIAGALGFLGLGFIVGGVARSEDAAAAICNVVTLPMVFLAGVFFPLDGAPAWLQRIQDVLPLTFLAEGLRDVAVRGASLSDVMPQLAALLGFAAITAAISLRYFRWTAH